MRSSETYKGYLITYHAYCVFVDNRGVTLKIYYAKDEQSGYTLAKDYIDLITEV